MRVRVTQVQHCRLTFFRRLGIFPVPLREAGPRAEIVEARNKLRSGQIRGFYRVSNCLIMPIHLLRTHKVRNIGGRSGNYDVPSLSEKIPS